MQRSWAVRPRTGHVGSNIQGTRTPGDCAIVRHFASSKNSQVCIEWCCNSIRHSRSGGTYSEPDLHHFPPQGGFTQELVCKPKGRRHWGCHAAPSKKQAHFLEGPLPSLQKGRRNPLRVPLCFYDTVHRLSTLCSHPSYIAKEALYALPLVDIRVEWQHGQHWPSRKENNTQRLARTKHKGSPEGKQHQNWIMHFLWSVASV